jgi:hypothetical protein
MNLAIAVAIAIGLFCLAAIVLAFWAKKKLSIYYQQQYAEVTQRVNEAENKAYVSSSNTYTQQLKPAPVLWFWLIPKTFFVIGISYILLLFVPDLIHLRDLNLHDFFKAGASTLFTFFAGAALFIAGIVYVCLWVVKLLWLLAGKEVIYIDNSNLIRTRTLAGIPLKNMYQLNHIADLRIAIMEDSNTSLFFRGNYQGFSVYYKNPILLYFTYKGVQKHIGSYCAYFNATELRQEITNRNAS